MGTIGRQHATKQKRITSRLTRDEAVAYLSAVMLDQPLPFRPAEYPGGATQILADAVCLGPDSIKNSAYLGRKTLPRFEKSDS
jgi:hypothetical protein